MARDSWKNNKKQVRDQIKSLGFNTISLRLDFLKILSYAEDSRDADLLLCKYKEKLF